MIVDEHFFIRFGLSDSFNSFNSTSLSYWDTKRFLRDRTSSVAFPREAEAAREYRVGTRRERDVRAATKQLRICSLDLPYSGERGAAAAHSFLDTFGCSPSTSADAV